MIICVPSPAFPHATTRRGMLLQSHIPAFPPWCPTAAQGSTKAVKPAWSKVRRTGQVLKPCCHNRAASSIWPSASHLQELNKHFWIAMQITGSLSHLCSPLLNSVFSTSPSPSKLSLFFSTVLIPSPSFYHKYHLTHCFPPSLICLCPSFLFFPSSDLPNFTSWKSLS